MSKPNQLHYIPSIKKNYLSLLLKQILFQLRYGPQALGSVSDNCQLSDWPVREMDRDRHLIADPSFDVYERASYGHGCEIRPIPEDKNDKKCKYLMVN